MLSLCLIFIYNLVIFNYFIRTFTPSYSIHL